MKHSINIFSEIGSLKTVIVHRPGKEIENLTPQLLEQLLFDDIPFLKQAIAEHDYFVKIMTNEGIKVLYIEDLVTEAFLNANKLQQEEFINQFIEEAAVKGKYVVAVKQYLLDLPAKKMIKTMIAGIKKNDLKPVVSKTAYAFLCHPLPNFLFQRDPCAAIGHGIVLNQMWSVTRNRETIFADLIFKCHHDFKNNVRLYYQRQWPPSIEGGDILVLNAATLVIGISQRTTINAAKRLVKEIFMNDKNSFEKIIILVLPKSRAFMHLDTVFTNVDYDKFLVHRTIFDNIDEFKIYEITKHHKMHEITQNLVDYLSVILGCKVKLIKCGGEDEIDALREQWNDATNVLTIRPGVVIGYARNEITNKLLRKNGVTVLEIPSSELSRGRGGPRCMTMPIYRENLKKTKYLLNIFEK